MHAQQNHASIRRGQGNVRRHLILLFSLFSLFSFLCSLNKKEKGKVERRERESLLRLRFWVPVPSGCMDEGRTYYYRASLLFLDTQVFVPFPMTGGPVAATYQWQRRSRQLLPRHSRTHHAPIPMPALPPPTKQKKKPPSLPPSLPPVNPSSGHHIHPPSRRAYIELLPPFPISPSRATLRPTYHRCPAPEARRTQNPPRSLSHPKSQPRRSWPPPPPRPLAPAAFSSSSPRPASCRHACFSRRWGRASRRASTPWCQSRRPASWWRCRRPRPGAMAASWPPWPPDHRMCS